MKSKMPQLPPLNLPPRRPRQIPNSLSPRARPSDAALIDSATPIFRELAPTCWCPARRFLHQVSGDAATKDAEAINTVRADWRKSHGRQGTRFQDRIREGQKLARPSPSFPPRNQSPREALDITGAGDHPAVVKAFYKLAQMVNEGTHVQVPVPFETWSVPDCQCHPAVNGLGNVSQSSVVTGPQRMNATPDQSADLT